MSGTGGGVEGSTVPLLYTGDLKLYKSVSVVVILYFFLPKVTYVFSSKLKFLIIVKSMCPSKHFDLRTQS